MATALESKVTALVRKRIFTFVKLADWDQLYREQEEYLMSIIDGMSVNQVIEIADPHNQLNDDVVVEWLLTQDIENILCGEFVFEEYQTLLDSTDPSVVKTWGDYLRTKLGQVCWKYTNN